MHDDWLLHFSKAIIEKKVVKGPIRMIKGLESFLCKDKPKSLGLHNLERIRYNVSEFNRSNFIDANRLHVVIYMVKIAWGVTSIKCFVCATLRKRQIIK